VQPDVERRPSPLLLTEVLQVRGQLGELLHHLPDGHLGLRLACSL